MGKKMRNFNIRPNCDRCIHITPNEASQQPYEHHMCTVYNARCLHCSPDLAPAHLFRHPFIYPCTSCEKDNYKQYAEN